jgi:regulator of nucleoside diphosphate kinase
MAISHETMPPVFMLERDLEHLTALVDSPLCDRFPDEAEALRSELDRAVVVAERLATDAVTMHSTVEYLDVGTGRRASITVVYPWEADPAEGRVSILAPVASALIGLRVGATIDWETKSRRRFTFRVLRVERGRDG